MLQSHQPPTSPFLIQKNPPYPVLIIFGIVFAVFLTVSIIVVSSLGGAAFFGIIVVVLMFSFMFFMVLRILMTRFVRCDPVTGIMTMESIPTQLAKLACATHRKDEIKMAEISHIEIVTKVEHTRDRETHKRTTTVSHRFIVTLRSGQIFKSHSTFNYDEINSLIAWVTSYNGGMVAPANMYTAAQAVETVVTGAFPPQPYANIGYQSGAQVNFSVPSPTAHINLAVPTPSAQLSFSGSTPTAQVNLTLPTPTATIDAGFPQSHMYMSTTFDEPTVTLSHGSLHQPDLTFL